MSGDHESILNYMATTDDVEGINSDCSFMWNGSHVMSWFLNDKSFYDKAIEVLRRRKLYDPKVWSYSLHHNDEQTMREFVNKGT